MELAPNVHYICVFMHRAFIIDHYIMLDIYNKFLLFIINYY